MNNIFQIIKNNYQLAIIVVLALLLLRKPTQKLDTATIHVDTVYSVHTKEIVPYRPTLAQTTHYDTSRTTVFYTPDTSYRGLLRQYNSILADYLATRTYKDTIKLDSVGYVAITDTIRQNTIVGRTPAYSYKIPTITKTITLPSLHREMYFGGGISSIGIDGGLLYKTKQGKIFNLGVGYSQNQGVFYKAGVYWKIF